MSVPTLIARGTDSGGAAVGLIFRAERDVTVTPEVGFVRDERDNLTQIGVGLRAQINLSRLLILGSTFPWWKADFDKVEKRLVTGLYGLQLRTTLYNIIPTAGQNEHGFRVELLYDF